MKMVIKSHFGFAVRLPFGLSLAMAMGLYLITPVTVQPIESSVITQVQQSLELIALKGDRYNSVIAIDQIQFESRV